MTILQNIRRFGLAFFALFLTLSLASLASAATFETGLQAGVVKRNAIKTENFRLEFSNLILNQVDSDGDGISNVIETVAEAAERSWDIIIDDLGYENPRDGASKIPVILDDTGLYLPEGALGVTTAFSDETLFVAVNPWLTSDYLKITMSHEFYHVVQFSYDIGFAYSPQAVNWAEATATWVEDLIYDDIDDYVNYYPDFFNYTDYSVFASIVPSNTLYEYALNIWPLFLSEYYEDDVILEVWEEYFDSSKGYLNSLKLYEAVETIVRSNGDEMGDVFRDFTLWNLDAADQYEEGNQYPLPAIIEGEIGGDYVLPADLDAPALFGSNYVWFTNSSEEDEFYFHLIKPDGVSFAVTLVPIYGIDSDLNNTDWVIVEKDADMTEELSLTGVSDADAIIAVISPLEKDFPADLNSTTFDEGYLYSYIAQFSTSLGGDIGGGADIEAGADKEGEEASFNSEDRLPEALNLNLVDYNENSASFSWNRPSDADLVAYEIHYGTDLDDLDEVYEIDRAYTIFAKITELEEDETYYFQLSAVDEDGREVIDDSQHVTVALEPWIYSDISYLHEHFEAISSLSEWGIVDGYPDGSFGPKLEINRAELLKILIEGQEITPSAVQYNNCFPDVPAGVWYEAYVCYAKAKGWVQGYPDNTFRPSNTVSKIEASKMLFEAYDEGLVEGASVDSLPYPDLALDAWYSVYVEAAADLGLYTEPVGESFNPEFGRIREDMGEELYRYLLVKELFLID